jgi:hypothetical protein
MKSMHVYAGVSTQPGAADAAPTKPQADKTASNCAGKETRVKVAPTAVVSNRRQMIKPLSSNGFVTRRNGISVRGCKALADEKAIDSNPEHNPSCGNTCILNLLYTTTTTTTTSTATLHNHGA